MLSQLDRQFLKRQFKILQPDISKWNKQEFSRLLALLKFSDHVQKQFLDIAIEQSAFKNLTGFIDRLQSLITDINYFPFQKLKCAVMLLSSAEDDSSQNSVLNKNFAQSAEQININQQNILSLVAAVDKLQDTSIIQLSNIQVFNLVKNCGLESHALLVKRFSIDGFTLVCSLTQWQVQKDIRNFFKDQDIKKINQISHLFLTQYFRQIVAENRRKTVPVIRKSKTQTENSLFLKKKNNNMSIIQSHILDKKNSEDEIELEPTEQNDQSVLGNSQMGTSQMGTSQMGTSQMGESEMGNSVRGSVYEQSQFAASFRGSIDCRLSFRVGDNNGRASLMYNSEIITQLRDACLKLPFNLLNLEPLHQIKIKAFGKQSDQGSWSFSVQGAKLGRDKENDLRFPDQLSISSKHAQILFKSQNFYLQDLGSKTGTYIKIQSNIPIQEQTRVQLSNEVQMLFKLIKKGNNQGMIIAEIIKPQDLSDCRIVIREGERILIGKSPKCNIRINSNTLADKHAQIFYKNNKIEFKNRHVSWLRLSAKSVRSEIFKLNVNDIFRISSKKSFIVEEIKNQLKDIEKEVGKIDK